MKAHLKINISLHLEGESAAVDPRAAEAVKYDLAFQCSGEKQVEDKSAAERSLAALVNAVIQATQRLSYVPVSGTHKPDLAAAFGGDPEPAALVSVQDPLEACSLCGGLKYHAPGCTDSVGGGN